MRRGHRIHLASNASATGSISADCPTGHPINPGAAPAVSPAAMSGRFPSNPEAARTIIASAVRAVSETRAAREDSGAVRGWADHRASVAVARRAREDQADRGAPDQDESLVTAF